MKRWFLAIGANADIMWLLAMLFGAVFLIWGCETQKKVPNIPDPHMEVHPNFSQRGPHEELGKDGKIHRYLQGKGPPKEVGTYDR